MSAGNPNAYLALAAKAADAREVEAVERGDYRAAREWRAVAAEIRRAWDLSLEASQPGKSARLVV